VFEQPVAVDGVSELIDEHFVLVRAASFL